MGKFLTLAALDAAYLGSLYMWLAMGVEGAGNVFLFMAW